MRETTVLRWTAKMQEDGIPPERKTLKAEPPEPNSDESSERSTFLKTERQSKSRAAASDREDECETSAQE